MNVIWIMMDSLRYDHLGANGNSWIKTPGLDAFAGKSLVCDRAFQLSFPTIPNRTDLFTGRYTFPRRGWTVLPKEEVTAAQRFAKLGMHTQMFFDTYHLKNNGYNFDRGTGVFPAGSGFGVRRAIVFSPPCPGSRFASTPPAPRYG
jgi:arylsulfatase A-like enzyme